MAVVVLPRSLLALFPGTPRQVEVSGATVRDVIADLEKQVPGMWDRICETGPAIRTHVNVFVSGERANLETAVAGDTTVHVIPAVSGG
jgi:molybdopterin synthase sulfur carrier subunit